MTPPTPKPFLESLPDAATLSTFDHEEACGLVINWSVAGVGFGEITIVRRKRTGEWRVDDECTGIETTARIIKALSANLNGSGPGWEPIAIGPDGASGGVITPRETK